jgi:protease-4
MTPFFKEMLDKVGIEMQVFYAGKFKSATEPYRLNEMSEQNKLQTREFLESIYRNFLEDISASRGIPVEDLKRIANNYEAGMASGALSSGLVDVIGHEEEVKQEIRERLGLDDDEKIPSVSLEDYNRSNPPLKDYSVRDKIAIIFAEGSIVEGEGETGIIGDDKYMKIIEDLRNDASVKAIVLRINSPGGSALASENIWKELQLTRDEGKPVIVSMSDYAASGGYYIASASDSIFAEPNTLTGSIGVLSVIPNTRKLLDEKIGINFDSIKTADMATGINILFDMTPKEERFMYSLTDSMYETFLDRVAQNRGMTRDAVHEIAQGRIWTGSKGQEIGLVDRIGGLEEAIQSAASLASLEEYRLTEYPRVKDPFQQLLEEWLNMETGNATQSLLRHEAPEWYEHYKFLKDIRNAKGVQARLPFVVEFD